MDFYINNRSLRKKTSPDEALSRRNFLKKSLTGAVAFAVGAAGIPSCTRGIPRLKRPYRTDYNTIAHKMLDLELVHGQDPAAYRQLEDLLRIAAHILGEDSADEAPREVAIHYLNTIDRIIKFQGFEYQTNSLLSTALITKKIDCDGYSAIYLAVGELLGLPIQMVRAPAHTFVRWHFPNGTYINWETTIGATKSDKYYITKHKIPKNARGKTSLRSMDVKADRKKILANTYVNCGVEWLKKLHYREALESFDRAIAGDPWYEAPYYNKGLVYFHMGNMDKAVEWCEKSVRLNPNHMKSHAVLGTAYKELNKSRKARLHFRRVRELDPEYYAVKVMEMQLSKTEQPNRI